MMNIKKTDFSGDGKSPISPGGVMKAVAASTLQTYSREGNQDGYPPRAIRCDAEGTLEVVDFSGNTTPLNVLQGELIVFMPWKITANTDIAVQVIW